MKKTPLSAVPSWNEAVQDYFKAHGIQSVEEVYAILLIPAPGHEIARELNRDYHGLVKGCQLVLDSATLSKLEEPVTPLSLGALPIDQKAQKEAPE
jgi:hypothetical protein